MMVMIAIRMIRVLLLTIACIDKQVLACAPPHYGATVRYQNMRSLTPVGICALIIGLRLIIFICQPTHLPMNRLKTSWVPSQKQSPYWDFWTRRFSRDFPEKPEGFQWSPEKNNCEKNMGSKQQTERICQPTSYHLPCFLLALGGGGGGG